MSVEISVSVTRNSTKIETQFKLKFTRTPIDAQRFHLTSSCHFVHFECSQGKCKTFGRSFVMEVFMVDVFCLLKLTILPKGTAELGGVLGHS